MITVQLNKANFEYDIHSLVKAFYPQHDVLVRAMAKEDFPKSAFHITVDYLETEKPGRICFAFFENGSAADDNSGQEELCGKATEESSACPVLDGEITVDFSNRRETKNLLKRRLYELLAEFSGRRLPWGTLTGIRPTKIPMEMLEHGKNEKEIRSYMRDTYFASEEKIDLSLDVAKTELRLLEQIDYEKGYSLYIGIPFCPSTCLYCSFTSYPLAKWAARMDEYLDAVEKEIDFIARACRDRHLDTVYIGGGTPTTLTPAQLDRLILKVGETFDLLDADGKIRYADFDREEAEHAGCAGGSAGEEENFAHAEDTDLSAAERAGHAPGRLLEFTVEAGRPDSITREKLEVLKKHNISRISINPQTMKEETLRLIGRQHTVAQTRESFHLARELGFDNINMDLIVGLPEEDIGDVRRTFDELEKLAPDNITVHSLAVKRAARLKMQQEDYSHLHIENTWETISLTAKRCRQMGMRPYYLYRQKNMAGNFENVGYALPGKEGIYNILIMEEKQTIMAVGAGAITKFVFDHGERIERVENVKDLTNYLERADEMIERKRKRMEELHWL